MKPRGGQGNCERSFSLVLEASSQIPKGPPLDLRDSVDFRSPGLLAAPLLGIAILLRITALLRVAALRITALLRVAALLRITALLLEAWILIACLRDARLLTVGAELSIAHRGVCPETGSSSELSGQNHSDAAAYQDEEGAESQQVETESQRGRRGDIGIIGAAVAVADFVRDFFVIIIVADTYYQGNDSEDYTSDSCSLCQPNFAVHESGNA